MNQSRYHGRSLDARRAQDLEPADWRLQRNQSNRGQYEPEMDQYVRSTESAIAFVRRNSFSRTQIEEADDLFAGEEEEEGDFMHTGTIVRNTIWLDGGRQAGSGSAVDLEGDTTMLDD